ncbi:unnamed protein product [Enterobius vermicularis]|uniref:DUF4819 domain-containing protein n=1 Tax=Enterobius vermicularis TaxID=51028 RepID=A0A0N4VME8_ENTVE|nr:unnamed protein product [Enterobius vermicularis]
MEESSRLKGNVVRDESSSMHPKLRGKRRNDDSCGLLDSSSKSLPYDGAIPLLSQTLVEQTEHVTSSSTVSNAPVSAFTSLATHLPIGTSDSQTSPAQFSFEASETNALLEKLKKRTFGTDPDLMTAAGDASVEPTINLDDWKGIRVLAVYTESGPYLPAIIKEIHDSREVVIQFEDGKERVFEDVLTVDKVISEIIPDHAPNFESIKEGDLLCAKWNSKETGFVLAEVVRKASGPVMLQMRLFDDPTSDAVWISRPNVRLLHPPWYDELKASSSCNSCDNENRSSSAVSHCLKKPSICESDEEQKREEQVNMI